MGKDGPWTTIEMDRALQNGNDHLGCKQTGKKNSVHQTGYFKLVNVKNKVQIDG